MQFWNTQNLKHHAYAAQYHFNTIFFKLDLPLKILELDKYPFSLVVVISMKLDENFYSFNIVVLLLF